MTGPSMVRVVAKTTGGSKENERAKVKVSPQYRPLVFLNYFWRATK